MKKLLIILSVIFTVAVFGKITLKLNNIHFLVKEHHIDTAYLDNGRALNQVLSIFHEYPDMKLEINGHADNDIEHNHAKDIASRRAIEVKQWFIDHGVNEKNLITMSWADERIIAPCEKGKDCSEANKQNRRVEFKILSLK